MRSLPKVVDGPKTWEQPAASFATCGASTAAIGSPLAAWSATSTLPTPAIAAACAATAAPSTASTSTSMEAPGIREAQLTHFEVLGLSLAPSCSETISILLITPTLLLERVHELGDVLHHDALRPLRWRFDPHRAERRRFGYAEVARRHGVERLLLRLHDVGQLDVARLIEAQVHAHHRGQVDLEQLQAGIHLAGDRGLALGDLDLRARDGLGRSHSAASICGAWPLSSSIACLPSSTRKGCSFSTSWRKIFATTAAAPPRRSARGSLGPRHRERGAQLLLRVAGPMETASTSSASPFSLMRSASSSAISSKG